MKKVLIITYYWPPASGPGVQRWLKFAKYLPQYGWQPIILTVEGGSYPAIDEGLLQEVSATVEVHRTKTWEPFGIYNRLRGKKGNQVEVGGGAFTADRSIMRRIGTYIRSNYFIPDARKGWNKYAIAKAAELIKSNNIKHIVTTSPPHSSQLIGLELKKRHDIKWLADLRDPWMSMMYNQILTRTKSSIDKDQNYENKVLANADHVNVVGNAVREEFRDRTQSISVITNGYDESDMLSLQSKEMPFEKFTLFFMGNFLSQQSIAGFWKAIYSLNNKHIDFRNSFNLLIIGNISAVVSQNIKSHDVGDLVTTEPFQPHEVVIAKMNKSHILYLPIPQTEGDKLITPGKIFEYLASKLPILATGPKNGDAAEILNQCKRSPIIDYDDQTAITERIESAWLSWKSNNAQVFHDNDLHQSYERSVLTERMAAVLDGL